jgi:single-stranded DNA-binding protein
MAVIKLTGHLGQDPEMGKTSKGNDFVKLRVAESNDYFDETSQSWINREPTWWFVTGFTNTIRKISEGLGKGSKISIEAKVEKKEQNIDGAWKTSVYLNAFKVTEIVPEA